MGEWLYYNFADGSFHTKNFVADCIRLKLNCIQNTKIVFEPPFGGTWGSRIRTPPIARSKARGRLPIRHN